MKTTTTSEKSFTLVKKRKNLQSRIVHFIYKKGSATINEIQESIAISTPTLLTFITELLDEQKIINVGKGKSSGGRKPDLYALNENLAYVMAVHIERFSIKIGIYNNHLQQSSIIKKYTFKINHENALEKLVEILLKNIEAFESNHLIINSVGIAMPGLIDTNGNNLSYLAPAEKISLKTYLEDILKKTVALENDVNSFTAAEQKTGIAKENALVLLMDWGMGLGIIQGGILQKGSTGYAGEIGHIPLTDNGRLCYCGKKGCLETVASGIAIAQLAKEGVMAGQNSTLKKLIDFDTEGIEPQVIIDAANQGDQFAIGLLGEVGESMGRIISMLIQLFNPQQIILAGKIADAKHFITVPLQYSINKYAMSQIASQTSIDLSILGENAGLIGIASTTLENIFEANLKKELE